MNAVSSWLKRAAQSIAAQAGIPASLLKKGTTIVLFLGVYFYWSWIFDNPIWWYAVSEFGYFYGNIAMMCLAIVHNFGLLCFFTYLYKKFGFDWLARAMEDLNSLASEMVFVGVFRAMSGWRTKTAFFFVVAAVKPLIFPTFIMALLLKGRWLSFFSLSVFADSFLTTAYLRQGRNGWLTGRDIQMFLLSSLVSCAYWSLRSSGVVAAAYFIASYLF